MPSGTAPAPLLFARIERLRTTADGPEAAWTEVELGREVFSLLAAATANGHLIHPDDRISDELARVRVLVLASDPGAGGGDDVGVWQRRLLPERDADGAAAISRRHIATSTSASSA